MSTKGPGATQTSMSSTDERPQATNVKLVANVALADAMEKQKPSPWTKNMFAVRISRDCAHCRFTRC